jgi:hypothetical protein
MDRQKVNLIINNIELLVRSLKKELDNENGYKYEEIVPYIIDDYDPDYYEEED